jgi:hypothetical protein
MNDKVPIIANVIGGKAPESIKRRAFGYCLTVMVVILNITVS